MGDNLKNQRVIVYEPELCTGCRHCEIACVFKHYGNVDLSKSYIRILFNGENGNATFEAVNCQHCEEPICVSVCPSEALTKDEVTGWVTVNSLKCIGCQMCVYMCPLSIPIFDEEQKATAKCDFCGGDPECVKHCSPAALKVMTREEALQLNKKLYLSIG